MFNPEHISLIPYVCIYTLADPRDGQIRYIGKSTRPKWRYRSHLNEKGKTRKHNWIKSLKAVGLSPVMEPLEEFIDIKPETWIEAERFWLAYFKFLGFNLTNTLDGGEGGFGGSPSIETRKKLSEALMGHPVSDEVRRKIGIGRKGIKQTLEARNKMSKSRTGKKQSEETIRKRADALKGGKRTPEQCQRISASLIGKFKGIKQSPESIIKRSKGLRRAWAEKRKRREENDPQMAFI